MNGLYVLKPWFSARLSRLRDRLIRYRISPNQISTVGDFFAVGAAAALAFLPTPFAALPVAVLLVARLACANLDGALARSTGRQTRWGAVLNELADRVADLVVVAGMLPHAPLAVVLGTALASTMPSWVSLAGAAAGAQRINGGPLGKVERCLLVVVAALTGWYAVILLVIAAGSVLTAILRLFRLARIVRKDDVVRLLGTR
jgi:CDP-diacylglycerol--glycerol-3-phosphate 3-phosphatidyltransferase